MEKKWFIREGDRSVGPFSLQELLSRPGVSRNTFAWCPGMEKWKKIEDIPELFAYFKEPKGSNIKPVVFDQEGEERGDEILTMTREPNYWYFFYFLLLLIILYLTYEFLT